MNIDEIGPIYGELGSIIAEVIRENPDGSFMYAEVGNNFVDCSLFKEADGKLIYRDCGINLTEKLSEIWNNIDKDRRWLGISYSIYGNKFKTSFIFTKDVDSSEFYADRRPRIVEAHFGKMAIDYSDP